MKQYLGKISACAHAWAHALQPSTFLGIYKKCIAVGLQGL